MESQTVPISENYSKVPVFKVNQEVLTKLLNSIIPSPPTPQPREVFNTKDYEFDDPIEPICKFYIENHCKFGQQCRFLHPQGQNDAQCQQCKVWVRQSLRQFGLLIGCNHVFCLPCIRQWRSRGNVEERISQSCPICMMPSPDMIESAIFISDGDYKVQIL